MDTSKLSRGEVAAVVGGALLAGGLFLARYKVASSTARLAGHGPGTYSGWQVHTIMRWLLLLAAIAPFVLAYIVVRDHALSWPRGELTAVIAVIAFGLLLYNGVIQRPGDPSSQVKLQLGFVVPVLGTALMFFGSVIRQNETETRRKPPGTF